MSKFHFIELKGSSRQRGQQHGQLLRAPIERAAAFIEPTHRVSPLLFDEYEGIAEGSGQTLEDILVLPGPYEITFETVALGDCSNLFVGRKDPKAGRHCWDKAGTGGPK